MLWKRVASSTILIPFCLWVVWIGGWPYKAITITIVVLALIEFCQLTRTTGVSQVVISFFSLLFCSLAFENIVNQENIGLFLGFSITCVLFGSFLIQILKDEADSGFLSTAVLVIGAIYIGWAFGYHIIQLRDLRDGQSFTYFLLITIWACDSIAYFYGKHLGKNKIRPNISPGKTIEGTVVGLLFSVISGIVLWHFLLPNHISIKEAILAALIIGITSQISDFSESIIKRAANVKDSGTLIPGHGGTLDRIDSMIFATPALYYYLRLTLGLE
ncbi:hypothetical protein CMK22_04045 [Candidatus Poribacteria bacterium]|nr:hypothetical protein [Candidatus Poribacteria bacterium]